MGVLFQLCSDVCRGSNKSVFGIFVHRGMEEILFVFLSASFGSPDGWAATERDSEMVSRRWMNEQCVIPFFLCGYPAGGLKKKGPGTLRVP